MEEEIRISMSAAFEFHKLSKDKSYSKLKELNLKRKYKNDDLELKRSIYQELSKQLKDKLNRVQTTIHFDLINEMIDYVQEYRSNLERDDVNNFNKSLLIQTGIISLSCSTKEYEFIFDLFIRKLNENELKNVILISSNEKLTLDKIMGLIYKNFLNDDLIEELGIKSDRKLLQNLRIGQFLSFYKQHFGNEPIILIIDDLISMNWETINQLFELLYNNIDQLPVLVFCGLYQASASLQSLIKYKTLNYLQLRSFTSKSALDIVDEVFNLLFIESGLSVKFGSKCLNHFYNTFFNYDFSIKCIEFLVNLAIWHFCYSNEYSYLNGLDHEFEEKVTNLNEKRLNNLLKLESLNEFKFDKKSIKQQLIEFFKNMRKIEKEFLNELKALFELVKGHSNYENFRKLYISFLTTSENDFKCYLNELENLLKQFSPDEWRAKLDEIIENELINQTKFVTLLKEQSNKLDNTIKEKVVEEKKSPFSGKMKNRFDFKLESAIRAKYSGSNSPFNVWKKETISLIKSHFNDLENPALYYLNELFYYDNLDQIKELNLVSFRDQILNRLDSSNQLISSVKKSSEQQKENNEIMNFEPEICTAFKLYRESQPKINLADWLESYIEFLKHNDEPEISSVTKSARKKVKTESARNELTNKFFSNVMDLYYLGILEKANNRSNDYAVKLIF